MHPLRHCRGVASGCIFNGDAVLAAVVEVDVIGAYGGCAYELNCSALEQVAVAARACASEQHLYIAQNVVIYLAARHVEDLLCYWLKKTFEIRDFTVGNYLHQAIIIAMINAVSIATSSHMVTGCRVSWGVMTYQCPYWIAKHMLSKGM